MPFFMLLIFADPCTPLRGGPAQGMCPVPGAMSGSGLVMVELLPASDPGRRIPPPLATTLARALEAYDGGRDLPADLRTAEATSRFCAEWGDACLIERPLVRWEVPENLVHNRPYLLDDGRVRIEWMRGGKLALLSFVRFSGGKVVAVQTAPASVPTMPVVTR